MTKRSMYVWKLAPIIQTEGSIDNIVSKAQRSNISALWIKIAEGRSAYQNVIGEMSPKMNELLNRSHGIGIEVWGWHVPICPSQEVARQEVENVRSIARSFQIDGLIMDAESGPNFFQGDAAVAVEYASLMRGVADDIGIPLGISSHDVPQNMPDWMPKFENIVLRADFNFPQVYYGSSPSVLERLIGAEKANSFVKIPFGPVGAGWIGDDGGCSSASACAQQAREFIRLVRERGYQEYSFWHWAAVPDSLWDVLDTTPA